MRTGHVHCSGDWNCGSGSEARNPARRNFAVRNPGDKARFAGGMSCDIPPIDASRDNYLSQIATKSPNPSTCSETCGQKGVPMRRNVGARSPAVTSYRPNEDDDQNQSGEKRGGGYAHQCKPEVTTEMVPFHVAVDLSPARSRANLPLFRQALLTRCNNGCVGWRGPGRRRRRRARRVLPRVRRAGVRRFVTWLADCGRVTQSQPVSDVSRGATRLESPLSCH